MADQVELPEDQEHFKLNEVCKLANVQPYMLRFWGTEFAQLEAAKSGTGQRLYSRAQVEVILEIRRLLFDEGLTIAGARKKISAMQEKGALPTPEVAEIADDEPVPEPEAPPKPGPARTTPPKAAPAAEAAARATDRTQPLLATLKSVREEVAKIVEELKTEP